MDFKTLQAQAPVINTYQPVMKIMVGPDAGYFRMTEFSDYAAVAKEFGIQWPIRMTVDAYFRYVSLTPKAVLAGLNVTQRWREILAIFSNTLENCNNRETKEMIFTFRCVVERKRPSICSLKAVTDVHDGKPRLTFKEINE
jgi:hypothetical protein